MLKIKKISINLLKLISLTIKKQPNHIFVIPHPNCQKDQIDLINYSASNLLSFLNYLLLSYTGPGKTVYLVCYNIERMKLFVHHNINNKIKIKFIPSHNILGLSRQVKFKYHLSNIHYKIRSKYIFCETGGALPFKVKKQTVVCFNYYIPFKNDYSPRTSEMRADVDLLFSTSKLAAQITSISSGVRFSNIEITGFPRNDNLLDTRNCKATEQWLVENGIDPNKNVVLYVPTYRDYDKNLSHSKKRNIFGFMDDSIYEYLDSNNIYLIVKFHPLQNLDVFKFNNRIKIFKPNYNINLYDLLQITKFIITDYSSIGYDYMMLDKPIIYNFFDFEKYKSSRNFSYDPIESFCPGPIVKSSIEFIEAISDVMLSENKFYNYNYIKQIMHKYDDNESSNRIYNILVGRGII